MDDTDGALRVFVVEDHAVMRILLRTLLQRKPDLAACGEAASADEALAGVAAAGPDLVLLDVSLPGTSGLELARELRARYPELPLAMLSGHGERSHVEEAFAAGAGGYILKGDSDEIPRGVRAVARGERYLSAALDR